MPRTNWVEYALLPLVFRIYLGFACRPVTILLLWFYNIRVKIILQTLTKLFFVFGCKILTKTLSRDKLLLVYKLTERELYDENKSNY